MRRARSASLVALVLALVSACSPSPDARDLPAANDLVTAAASTLSGLTSIQYDFSLSGNIPGLDVREVKGWAGRAGEPYGSASGQADMQETTNRFQLRYQVAGDQLVLTRADGTRTQQPLPAEFVPRTLFDPAHGLPKLLTSATAVKTETKEDVKGTQAYRVTGELSKNLISSVLPQIQSDVDVKFWVTESQPRNLVRVWLQVPPRQPNEGAVMIELALSGPDSPANSMPTG